MGNGHFFSHIRKAIGHRVTRHVVPWRTALARAHPAEQVVLAGEKLNLPREQGVQRALFTEATQGLMLQEVVHHLLGTQHSIKQDAVEQQNACVEVVVRTL